MTSGKCKFCDARFSKFSEIRIHVEGSHPAEWQKHVANMKTFDQDHAGDLARAECPTCLHRGKRIHAD